jgi:hypothetical protein
MNGVSMPEADTVYGSESALDREDSRQRTTMRAAAARRVDAWSRRMVSDERRATKETGEKGLESRRARQLSRVRRSAQGPQCTEDT